MVDQPFAMARLLARGAEQHRNAGRQDGPAAGGGSGARHRCGRPRKSGSGRCAIGSTGAREPPDVLAGQRSPQIAHGPARLQQHRRLFVHVVHQKRALAESRQGLVEVARIEALGRRRGQQTVPDAIAILLGLQPADEPRASVGQRLVVEIHGVLRRKHDAKTEGPRLLQQGEQQDLRRRRGHRRQEAEDFIHIENGAQR